MYFEYFLAALDVGIVHDDLPVETAGAQQRRVEYILAVGRREHDDSLVGLETVHLDEQLVQCLLALVVAAAKTAAAVPPNGVDFINEQYTGRILFRVVEHIAHARRAHAHKHLHKVAAADREERHASFPGDRLGEQRLAAARRAD